MAMAKHANRRSNRSALPSQIHLEKQVNQVKDGSGGENIVDSSLQATQLMDIDNDNEDGANEEIEEVTKYFTMPVSYGKSSPWWKEFELFIPVKHLELHPICLLAVWPVSVSYRHLPVGIFGTKLRQNLGRSKLCAKGAKVRTLAEPAL
jgi:hypothetical protein